MAAPLVEIVIVSYRCEALLRDCLLSLATAPPSAEHRITVVDNASGDGTPGMVRAEFPAVRLIELADNQGFSYSNNLILRQTDAPFVLLLNPDTVVRPGAIDTCLTRIETESSIGMVGCKLVMPSGELDHACKRSFPTPLAALAHFTGIGRRAGAAGGLSQYRATHLGDDEPGDVDAVNGAFMLARMEAVRAVGLLDEGYWLYMEDLDWCARFWRSGWRVFYEPAGTVIHVKGGSSGARRGLRQEIAFHRGMGRFYRRFDGPSANPILSAAVYAGIGAKVAVSLARTGLTKLRRG